MAENKIGWWFFPSIVGGALLGIGTFLIPITLMLIPVYIYGYSSLTIHYKITVLLSFFGIGLITNLIEFGRKKKDALYQVAWSFYVAAFIGFIGLLQAWADNMDFQLILKPGIFYASYLIFSLVFIRAFHIKFQYFSWSTTRKPRPKKPIDPNTPLITREKNIRARRSWWNLLNPLFIFFFGWLFIFQLKIYTLGFRGVWLLIPRDSFTVVFPDGEATSLIWPGFYVLGGLFAMIPVILIFVNLVEMLIPWARRAFEKDAENNPEISFKHATRGLMGAVKWMTLPLLPFMLFGLMRFYYFDPLGVHQFNGPFKTADYSWKSVRWIQMKVWGDGESDTVYHMQYELMLPNEQNLEVSYQFFVGTTDHDVAESYLKLSRLIKDIPSIAVKTDVSPQGLAFLKQELGDEAKDVLLKPENKVVRQGKPTLASRKEN